MLKSVRVLEILGEDVLVELRQHDDYISGRNSTILRTFESLQRREDQGP